MAWQASPSHLSALLHVYLSGLLQLRSRKLRHDMLIHMSASGRLFANVAYQTFDRREHLEARCAEATVNLPADATLDAMPLELVHSQGLGIRLSTSTDLAH
eukprot:11524343-Karenia_brevis.AAC.1